MQKVFSQSSQCAHVWAQQKQSEGRSGNVFFRDSMIFSYGEHFMMAKFVTNKKGKRAVLFTTRTYSSTTSRHLGDVRQALRGLDFPVFKVDLKQAEYLDSHVRIKADYVAQVAVKLAEAKASRLHTHFLLSAARGIAEEANAYSKFFALRWQLKLPMLPQELLDKSTAANQRADALRATRDERDKVKREAAIKQHAIDTAEKRAAWLAGANVSWPGHPFSSDEATLLRVFGDSVQTTRGAEIPVEHARRVWPLILRSKERGTEWRPNGHREPVGHFEIEEVRADGSIKAGCHVIAFDQISKVAQQLGLLLA